MLYDVLCLQSILAFLWSERTSGVSPFFLHIVNQFGQDFAYQTLSMPVEIICESEVLRTFQPQRLFQMRGQKMNQTKFLSQTLWQFCETSAFTDLVLVCKDGEMAVHSSILAPIFIKFGLSCFSANLGRPECLVMPDHRYLSLLLRIILLLSKLFAPSLSFVLNLFTCFIQLPHTTKLMPKDFL